MRNSKIPLLHLPPDLLQAHSITPWKLRNAGEALRRSAGNILAYSDSDHAAATADGLHHVADLLANVATRLHEEGGAGLSADG